MNQSGIYSHPDKVKAIEACPTPTSVKEVVRSFIGLAVVYQRFIPGFADFAAPLTATFKKDMKWEWKERQVSAFTKLKEALVNRTHLYFPDLRKAFHMHMDSSEHAICATLLQQDDNGDFCLVRE